MTLKILLIVAQKKEDHNLIDFSLDWSSDKEGIGNESGNFGQDSKVKFLLDSSPVLYSREILSDDSIKSIFGDEKKKSLEPTEETNNSSDSRGTKKRRRDRK